MAPIADDTIHTYTILHGDGLYNNDDVEQTAFKPRGESQQYRVNYVEAQLWPIGQAAAKPWSTIDKSLRDQCEGITFQKPKFTAADLDLFPRLKVVVRMGVGYDQVDRVALAKRGVTLCNIPDYGTCEVADHAMALVLALRRGIILYHDTQRADPPGNWTAIPTPLVARSQDATFGILGLGRIGMAVALRAKAFGWKVLFYDPHVPMGVDRSLGIERTREIGTLFKRSTILSLHCPSTKETKGMVGYGLLSLMPRGAVLVNTARGDVVDLDGVQKCLEEGIISGAGLDVVSQEPIPADDVHPLIQAYRNKEDWLVGRMIISPHSAWNSPESLFDIRTKTAETMRDVLIDGLKTNVIDPEQS